MKTAHILLGIGVAIGVVVVVRKMSPAMTPATPAVGTVGAAPVTVKGIVETLGGKPAPLDDRGATNGPIPVRSADGESAISDAMGLRTKQVAPNARRMTRRQRALGGISAKANPFAGAAGNAAIRQGRSRS